MNFTEFKTIKSSYFPDQFLKSFTTLTDHEGLNLRIPLEIYIKAEEVPKFMALYKEEHPYLFDQKSAASLIQVIVNKHPETIPQFKKHGLL